MSSELDPNTPPAEAPAAPGEPEGKEQPITQFARFFKTYSLGLSLVVAAVPLGMARWSLVPMFETNKYSLTIITSVASYLLVGFIFSQRHAIANLYFPGVRRGMVRGKTLVAPANELRKSKYFSRLVPSALALFAIALFVGYLFAVSEATHQVAYQYATDPPEGPQQPVLTRARLEKGLSERIIDARLPFGQDRPVKIISEEKKVGDKVVTVQNIQFPDEDSVRALLAGVPSTSIPQAGWMFILFTGAFLCAAAAFVLMGLKDYMQEVLHLTDKDLITNPTVGTIVRHFQVEGVQGVHGKMEYSPHNLDYQPTFDDSCYCDEHDQVLLPKEYGDGVVVKWQHVWRTDKNTWQRDCDVTAKMSTVVLERCVRDSGWKAFQEEVSRAGAFAGVTKPGGKHKKGGPNGQAGRQPQEAQKQPVEPSLN